MSATSKVDKTHISMAIALAAGLFAASPIACEPAKPALAPEAPVEATLAGVAAESPKGATLPVSTAAKLDRIQSGFYRMKIGAINVTALSDGSVTVTDWESLALNAKPGEVSGLFARAQEKGPIDGSINAFLIQLDGKAILVDAGTSELVGPTAGKLPDSLRAAGVSPEDITDIFITHIHPDHTGGLMDGTRRVFPRAVVHVDKREAAFWFDKALAAKSTGLLKLFFSQVDPKVKPYVDSGQVKTFDGATEFHAGFRSQPAYGHTPGHTFYVLENGGQKLVFLGDMLHIGAVQFDDPGVAIRFDVDPVTAVEVRRKTFADAAEKGYLVAAAHLSFPGVGHVGRDGDHYRWLPSQYVNDAIRK